MYISTIKDMNTFINAIKHVNRHLDLRLSKIKNSIYHFKLHTEWNTM